ncbi:MAG: hypothetical protein BWK76_26970 [Desulfobulbaceae bacterium A2]|nr:MAG: hypothetical protein BWK76_26970 [Desulfobulbaceae bacterium A2]
MSRKRSDVQPLRPELPIYPIGVAARLVDVHPRTLRIYENEGLIKPLIRGSRRLFSANDIQWIRCLRRLIHEEGISIPGLRKLLSLAPCWEIAQCPPEVHLHCSACIDWALPRLPHVAGDEAATRAAKQEEAKRGETAGNGKKKRHSSV